MVIGQHYPDSGSNSLFSLTAHRCLFYIRKTANTNFIVFGLTKAEIEPMIFHT